MVVSTTKWKPFPFKYISVMPMIIQKGAGRGEIQPVRTDSGELVVPVNIWPHPPAFLSCISLLWACTSLLWVCIFQFGECNRLLNSTTGGRALNMQLKPTSLLFWSPLRYSYVFVFKLNWVYMSLILLQFLYCYKGKQAHFSSNSNILQNEIYIRFLK